MSKKIYKILCLLLCLCFIFEQTGFAQSIGQLDISGYLSSLRNNVTQDKFRPLHLRYLAYDTLNNNFNLLVDKGSNLAIEKTSLEDSAKPLMDYFFVGLSLPNESFRVNLRPDAETNIIDDELAKTDIGKIMLEADVQLKKDTARYTSPNTAEGKEYWGKLYKKAGEIFGYENVQIPTLTRPWIVPDEILVGETKDGAYIFKATLKVMLEQDYLKDSAVYNFNDERLRALNEYSSQLIRELIIPKITQEVNSAKRYASLRQVYYSLILAQWFKQKFQSRGGYYSQLIDRKNLTSLASKLPWSKTTYFKEYQKSFKNGEYNTSESVYTPYGQTIRSYFSGGIKLAVSPANNTFPADTIPSDNPNLSPLNYDGNSGKIGARNNIARASSPVVQDIWSGAVKPRWGYDFDIQRWIELLGLASERGMQESGLKQRIMEKLCIISMQCLMRAYLSDGYPLEEKDRYLFLETSCPEEDAAEFGSYVTTFWQGYQSIISSFSDQQLKDWATFYIKYTTAAEIYLYRYRKKYRIYDESNLFQHSYMHMKNIIYSSDPELSDDMGTYKSRTQALGLLLERYDEEDTLSDFPFTRSFLERHSELPILKAFVSAIMHQTGNRQFPHLGLDIAVLFEDEVSTRPLKCLGSVTSSPIPSDALLAGGGLEGGLRTTSITAEEIGAVMDEINALNKQRENKVTFDESVKTKIIQKIQGLNLEKGKRALVVGTGSADYLPILLAKLGLKTNTIDTKAYTVDELRRLHNVFGVGQEIESFSSYEELGQRKFDYIFVLGVINYLFDVAENEKAYQLILVSLVAQDKDRERINRITDEFAETEVQKFIAPILAHLNLNGGFIFINSPTAHSIDECRQDPANLPLNVKELYYLDLVLGNIGLRQGVHFALQRQMNIDNFSMHPATLSEKRKGVIYKCEEQTGRIAQSSPIVDAQGSIQNENQAKGELGGIDFRNLPIVTQALSNLSAGIGNFPLSKLNDLNLNSEWQEIERLVQTGITPSGERMKEYLQASCYNEKVIRDKKKVISCISDIMRLQEERYFCTDPVLRDILVVLESGRSIEELRMIFIGVKP